MFKGIGEGNPRNLAPWDRITWAGVGTTVEVTEENGVVEDQETSDDNDDVASIASTISTVISIPRSDADFGDYTRFFPKESSLRPWSAEGVTLKSIHLEMNKTTRFYQILGNHLGYTLNELRKQFKEMEHFVSVGGKLPEDAKKPQNIIRNNQDFLHDTLRYWKDDYNKRTKNNKNPRAFGERQTPLYKDVVQYADLEFAGRTWTSPDSWDDKEEHEACEAVRQGLLREAHENKTNILSSRPSLWTFGKPEVRGFTIKRLFSINRWPLHLQSEKVQEAIKNSVPACYPADLMKQALEKEKGEEDVETDIPYQPSVFPGADDREFWHEGNEYWLGATPQQQRRIWKETHRKLPVLTLSKQRGANRQQFKAMTVTLGRPGKKRSRASSVGSASATRSTR